mmetsp:Transcript_20206/g.39219  ORF Transcript_20206/g.39219 Transcript_20206/m.39219 type:complete len:238 (+) Transcript_20206:733-1446(+)
MGRVRRSRGIPNRTKGSQQGPDPQGDGGEADLVRGQERVEGQRNGRHHRHLSQHRRRPVEGIQRPAWQRLRRPPPPPRAHEAGQLAGRGVAGRGVAGNVSQQVHRESHPLEHRLQPVVAAGLGPPLPRGGRRVPWAVALLLYGEPGHAEAGGLPCAPSDGGGVPAGLAHEAAIANGGSPSHGRGWVPHGGDGVPHGGDAEVVLVGVSVCHAAIGIPYGACSSKAPWAEVMGACSMLA